MTETHALISSAEAESVRTTALEELFSTHSPTLYRVALRKLGNPADAEDALQDALLSAFKHFDQFKGDAQLSTWLTSIVLNAARMQLRRNSSRHFVSLDDHDDDKGFVRPEIIADAGPDPEEILRQIQMRAVLERFATKLPPKIRRAFQLCILEGLTAPEAAKHLGITLSALKGQVFRARRQITPLLRRAFASPVKSRKRLNAARLRNTSGKGVTSSPERSRDGHLASSRELERQSMSNADQHFV